VVIFALCGFSLTRAAAEIKASWKEPWIAEMKKKTNNRMYIVDGNYLVNRSGPRVVESCEAIAEAIHPQLQGHFGHFGTDLLTSFDCAMALSEAGEHTGSTKVRPEPIKVEEQITNVSGNTTEDNHSTTNASCKESPIEVVSSQLKYLEKGDVKKAFALNSSANQDRWCGPERFSEVLKSHGDYRRLLEEPSKVGKCEEKDGMSTVVVTVPADESEGKKEVHFLWTMVMERSVDNINIEDVGFVWRTEKVGTP